MAGDASSPSEDRLHEIIGEYLEALGQGTAPGRQEFLDRHPDLADELGEFLADYEGFRRIRGGDPGDVPASISLKAGERIGDYRILEEIGRGGMGVVFKARQVGLNRVVALKLILAGQLATEEEVERFRREARAAARLDHPHLVSIHEIGRHEGIDYFSMQYVDGETLSRQRELFRGDPVSIANLLETIARAVDHAHQRGILHRDLKPANILIDRDGQPHVSDFGLSKLLAGGPSLTRSGAVLGTPSYMAPEQARSGGERDTPATDVYSLGAILYELLTGKPPFEGPSSLDVLEQLRSSDPVRPRSIDGSIPLDLESICLKCLEKKPSRRYADGGELADDLRRFLDGMPVRARRITAAGRAWRTCRRNPVVSGLLASIIAALLVLVAWLGWSQSRSKEILWGTYLQRAQAGSRSGQPGQRLAGLDVLRQAAAIRFDERIRDEAIACMARVDAAPIHRSRIFSADDLGDPWSGDRHQAALDREFRLCARQDEKGRISIEAVGSRKPLHLLPGTGSTVRRLTFSPDGRFIAVRYADARLRVWEIPPAAELQIGDCSVSGPEPWDFRSDSSGIAIGSTQGRVTLHDLPSGAPRAVLQGDGSAGPILLLRYRPDQEVLAVYRQGGNPIELWSAATGAVLKTLPLPGAALQMAWHPRGESLAVVVGNDIHLLSPEGRESTVLQSRHSNFGYLAFHPDGLLLGSSCVDFLRLWNVQAGQEVLRIEQHYLLGFSADGGLIGSVDSGGEMSIWRLELASEWSTLGRFPVGLGYIKEVAIDPTSRFAAVSTQDGVWIIDIVSGRELARLPTGETESTLFAPSGKGLFTLGHRGLHRWPLMRESGEDGATSRIRIRLGPPARFEIGRPGTRPGKAALSAEGGTLAVIADALTGKIIVLDGESGAIRAELSAGGFIDLIALGPDGRRLAVSGMQTGIVYWDLRDVSGSIRKLPGMIHPWVAFSRDGRKLLAGMGQELSILDAESWEATARVPLDAPISGVAAFSNATNLAAVRNSRSSLKLIDAESGRKLATIETPEIFISGLCFDPTGRRLFLFGRSACLRVLDLDLVQERLEAMGIDGDLGAFSGPRKAEQPVDLEVEVDAGGGLGK